MSPRSIVVLCGPTASGKSAAAIDLAERIGGEIVSCDSLAVYRGLDIGTAKPSRWERATVPHHLIDLVDPQEPFTAARYVEEADRAIAAIGARGRTPVVVGGTGLYLRALVEGLFPSLPPNPEVRARLQAEAAAHGWPALHERLVRVDPTAADRIAPSDPIRIERALEVYEQTGRTISQQQAESAPQVPRYRTMTLVLEPSRAELEQRIMVRTEAMLAAGLIEETRAALAAFGRGIKPLGAVGYKQVVAFLDGARVDRAALAQAITTATRQFAKRQCTWFTKTQGQRFAAPAEILGAIGTVEQFLHG